MKNRRILIRVILLSIALLNTAIYWSVKPIWFFIDKELGPFMNQKNFWSQCFLFLFIAQTAYSAWTLMMKRSSPVHRIIISAFSAVLTVFNVYLFTMLGSEKQIIIRNLTSLLPALAVSLFVLFTILFYPELKISKEKRSREIAAALVLALLFLLTAQSGSIEITSGPNIQYTGENTFAILWTTDENSTGWIEYGPSEDQLSIINHSEKGLIQGNSKIHKVIMSEDIEDGFIFRAGSRRIKDFFQNNVVYGETVYSDFITYEDNKSDDEISFYVLSDIHERKDIYEKYLSDGDYDFLVLGGDLISSVDSRDIIVDEMLKPLSEHTEGFRPFYFVRGNHETRGASARNLPDYLALPGDSYYYTFSYGPLFAVVLDSGEDKPDSHEEYAGLADFEAYRKAETEWLRKVSESDAFKEAKYRVVFNHIPLNSYGRLEEGSPLRTSEEEWVKILNAMEIDALISGHTHRSQIIEPHGTDFQFPIIVGGGYVKARSGYEGIKVEADGDAMTISIIDEQGIAVDNISSFLANKTEE